MDGGWWMGKQGGWVGEGDVGATGESPREGGEDGEAIAGLP